MILGVTGHRVIINYDKLYLDIVNFLKESNPEYTISGVAVGFDQLFSVICIRMSIPFVAAVPFNGQEKMWPEHVQKQYNKILNKAKEVVIVSPGDFDKEKFQIRNEYIVNNSDEMLAYWNGKNSGTGNCVRYAKGLYRRINNIY